MKKIVIDVSEEYEGTTYPRWCILERERCKRGAPIENCIVGPFFSREEAEDSLRTNKHLFDNSAEIWCLSGYLSGQYKMAFHEME
jgi:hypothetical protein